MNKETVKNTVLDFVYDILGAICYAIGLDTFARTADFSPGGISGLALIFNHLFSVPIGITSIILNIPLMLFSYKILGKTFFLKTIKTMCFCTLFLDAVFPLLPAYTGSRLMAALYSGVMIGVGLALFYMRGSSSGGIDFITMSIKSRRPHLSIGALTMIIDLFIILLGWPVFGDVDAVLYGLISLFVTSVIIDKIMYGISSGTLLIIITTQGDEIAAHISECTGRGATKLNATGCYTKDDRDVLLCACSKSQAYMVRRMAREIDSASFVMITETSEVFGEGFLN